ncbi:MAG: HigA family addiction module antidote protein [Gammaproteobacteria bacterium]|nr:HigA family addiction module antidote protein [Gammaproteobacteria bacterium]
MSASQLKNRSVNRVLEEDFMNPYGLSQSELAQALHIPRARISDILRGKRAITADTDLRFCKYFGVPEGYFLNLQNQQLLQETKGSLSQELNKIKPLHGEFDKTIVLGQSDETAAITIGVICGGPSLERGISLNSSRSILDHLSQTDVAIVPIYVDRQKKFYEIFPSQLYSNTPSDFDFKLSQMAKKLNTKQLIERLKSFDMVFPVVHGPFGEDGELQSFLEQHHIPFIGSGSQACDSMFHKLNAAKKLKKHGYYTLDAEELTKNDVRNEQRVRQFFEKHNLHRAVVKPVAGGSSIGVYSADTPEEAIERLSKLFDLSLMKEALIEPFCEGTEFTVIVLQNSEGEPVALIPSEIRVSYENGQLFDYRRKYLPTNNTQWLCPPHFDDKVVEKIQRQAEELFTLFGMRDFARLDGWLLNDGQILFSDFNPISGMEQNSFLFQQASRLGMTHRDVLWNVIANACRRERVRLVNRTKTKEERLPVRVLFGGSTAERQVSLMSGTNVWLKLRKSDRFAPSPYLLDKNGHVWMLPYTYTLNHTAEEIFENCVTASSTVDRLEQFVGKIRKRLNYVLDDYDVHAHLPKKLSFEQFLEEAKKESAFLFLGLHGGEGEDGTIQQQLEEKGILYNGSGPEGSELCMDKYMTGVAVSKIGDPSIITAPKKMVQLSTLATGTQETYQKIWDEWVKELGAETLIMKPKEDGCSAGVVRLYGAKDLYQYAELLKKKATFIPEGTFKNQDNVIEMSLDLTMDYLVESCIETDFIRIKNNELVYKQKTGWLEFTVGVLETKGIYHSFNPSITIAEGEVLSVEEKFQGGTGVNITPPPESIVSAEKLQKIKHSIEKVARALNIRNYARVDIFFNVLTEQIIVIEANTLPGLTASTVIYHQALAENPSMTPIQFLERIVIGAIK